MSIFGFLRRGPKTFGEFVELAKRKKWVDIAVEMRRVAAKKKGTSVFRSGGHVDHWLDFVVTNSRGRKVVFRELAFGREDGGYSDDAGRRAAQAEHSRFATSRASELNAKLPGVFIHVE